MASLETSSSQSTSACLRRRLSQDEHDDPVFSIKCLSLSFVHTLSPSPKSVQVHPRSQNCSRLDLQRSSKSTRQKEKKPPALDTMSAPGTGGTPGSGSTGGQYFSFPCRNHNVPGHERNYQYNARKNELCQNCQVSQFQV